MSKKTYCVTVIALKLLREKKKFGRHGFEVLSITILSDQHGKRKRFIRSNTHGHSWIKNQQTVGTPCQILIHLKNTSLGVHRRFPELSECWPSYRIQMRSQPSDRVVIFFYGSWSHRSSTRWLNNSVHTDFFAATGHREPSDQRVKTRLDLSRPFSMGKIVILLCGI